MAETKINANQTSITASDIGAASTAQLNSKQDILQYETLPTASADELGNIYQFVGATDSTCTNGYFYKCTESGGVYSWVQTDVQPSSSGGISDVTVNGTSVVSGGVATITCATIDDTSTSSLTATWSASKLNTTIGNIESLLAAI